MKTFVLLLLGSCLAIRSNYKKYAVIRSRPQTNQDLNLIEQFVTNAPLMDFWSFPYDIDSDVDVLLPPDLKEEFQNFLNRRSIQHRVLINNVQELIDRDRRSGRFQWTQYNTLAQIESYLYSLPKRYKQVKIINVGSTYEGRNITGVHLSYSFLNQKRSIFIEANIHAREWITSAVATFIIDELLTSKDPGIRKAAESHDWYIVPVANPDGFVYSHETDRLWRKTRSRHHWLCRGADPNRNWNNHWSEIGVSKFACSNIYPGPKPFSETCTRTMSAYISTIGDKIMAYLSFHAPAQALGIPYGYSPDPLDNFNLTYDLGLQAVKRLEKRYGTKYKLGNINRILAKCSGVSVDWVKSTFKTPLAYVYELRDKQHGFLLPADKIVPTGQETLDSIVTLLEEYRQRMDALYGIYGWRLQLDDV